MSDESVFLLYALSFRFSVLAAGSYAMFLGYSLLRDSKGNIGSESNAEVAVPGVRFKIQKVAAGSIFALFGAVLIVAMVLQGNPEKTRQMLSEGGRISITEKVRGDFGDSIQSSIQAGLDAEKRGAPEEAKILYRDALYKTAPAMNGLAWIYAGEGKAKSALAFSQSAVELDNNNAHYLDTLAEVEFGNGDQASALRTIERAAQLDSTFKARFEEFRKRLGK